MGTERNTDSDSNSSETHRNDQNIPSQAAVNQQISQLHNEMSVIRSLLATLTQQVFPRLEEGSALRASISRPYSKSTYTSFSTTVVKLEKNSHFVTDTITLYSHFVFSATHLM